MRLYTTLTRIKMALGGTPPPMTPLTEKARTVIREEFVEGMGGLQELRGVGLRCPVCGKYRHMLTLHLNKAHADIGGAATVRDLLSIPETAPLVSNERQEQLKAKSLRERAAGKHKVVDYRKGMTPKARAKSTVARKKSAKTFAALNLRDSCPAQVFGKLIALEHKLGRSPSSTAAVREYGPRFLQATVELFGSWNAAKAMCGLATQEPRKKHSPDDIYASLEEYFRVHGRLPTAREAARADRLPFIPNRRTIYKALGTTSWTVAMQRVAGALGVDDPRYGPSAVAA